MITFFAQLPALPLHTAGRYVAAAYIVFLVVIIIYVAIMAKRLITNQREILELRRMAEEREQASRPATGLAGPVAETSVPEHAGPRSETVA